MLYCARVHTTVVRQLAAIYRTCYEPRKSGALLRGINASVGCRTWTNANNFTARYCFCDTDLCNVAPSRLQHQSPLNVAVVALPLASMLYVPSRC